MEESDLIDKYVLNTLTDEDLKDLEELLKNDPDLRSRVRIRQAVINGIRETRVDDLRAKLKQYDRELDRKHISFFSLTGRTFLIPGAAAIVLVVFLLLRYHHLNRYEKYNVAVIGLPNTMSSVYHDPEFVLGMNDFKEKKYNQSGKIFESSLRSNPDNDTLLFYAGISAINIHKFNKAAEHLEKVKTGSRFYLDSKYFLAFAYLNLGEKEKVKEIFRDFSFKGTRYEDNSSTILEELK